MQLAIKKTDDSLRQIEQAEYLEQIEARIKTYWNTRSNDFSARRRQELGSQNAAAWRALIEKHLPKGRPLKILDVGTGAGFFAILLAKTGHHVTGIDMSGDMIHEAKANSLAFGCRAAFRQMNAMKLDFASECFDAVITRNLTWTLPDVVAAYREWHRVLNIGGVLLNFDSDCGLAAFSKQGAQASVHANVTDQLLEECNAIKEELRISTHRRPAWDIAFLQTLGFSVTSDADVSPLVHLDPQIQYDGSALFGIYAVKKQ